MLFSFDPLPTALLVASPAFCSARAHRDCLADVIHEAVHDAHRLGGNASTGLVATECLKNRDFRDQMPEKRDQKETRKEQKRDQKETRREPKRDQI